MAARRRSAAASRSTSMMGAAPSASSSVPPPGSTLAGWTNGAAVRVIGVVGQRDSSGTGTSGYRVQPRAADDVEVLAGATPTPTPTAGGSPGPEPTPTPSASNGAVVPIANARAAAKNARVTVRGVVTLASGTVDAGSAVIQDGSGAILLRLGDEAGQVSRGQLLEVAGVRSTKSGMESLRVTVAPRRLGTSVDPAARALRSGDAAEAFEAQLVVVRGAVVASARNASSGTVSFELDDGSGPLRIVLGASLAADRAPFSAGTWVEVLGVLGQETTGAQPLRGYRVWPRSAGDVRDPGRCDRHRRARTHPLWRRCFGKRRRLGRDRVARRGRRSRPGRPARRRDAGGVGMAGAGRRRPALGWIATGRHRAGRRRPT